MPRYQKFSTNRLRQNGRKLVGNTGQRHVWPTAIKWGVLGSCLSESFFLIEEELIYNTILVLDVQHSDSESYF